MRYSPVNLGGRDSTKSVYSTISSFLQSSVILKRNEGNLLGYFSFSQTLQVELFNICTYNDVYASTLNMNVHHTPHKLEGVLYIIELISKEELSSSVHELLDLQKVSS